MRSNFEGFPARWIYGVNHFPVKRFVFIHSRDRFIDHRLLLHTGLPLVKRGGSIHFSFLFSLRTETRSYSRDRNKSDTLQIAITRCDAAYSFSGVARCHTHTHTHTHICKTTVPIQRLFLASLPRTPLLFFLFFFLACLETGSLLPPRYSL